MRLSKQYSRLSLRWKIIVPFLAVALIVSFTGTWLLGRSLEGQLYDRARGEVQQEAALAALYLEREQSYFVSQLIIMVEEGKMLTGNQGSITEAMSEVDMASAMRILGISGDSLVQADLVKIVDPDGQTAFELHPDILTGGRLDDEALIAKALQGASGDIVTTTDGQSAYVVGAVLVPSVGTSGGVLMLGTKINQDLLIRMGLSERTLFALTDRGIAACSDLQYVDANWTQALATASSGLLTVTDKRYVTASAPVNVDGKPSAVRVAVAMPVDPLAAKARSNWNRTWLIFGAGALMFVIAGFAVARQVVRPVRQLTTAAGRLKDGDLGARSEVRRDDELGELAQAFDTMGEELKRRDAHLRETLSEVKRLSETDALTGLLNHRTVAERMADELARAKRYGNRFGVMIVDLDNFKLLNDTYGHPVGDEVLRRITRLLLEQTRATDSIGRHGGDEFMLVLPESGPGELAGTAAKLQSVLAESSFEAPDGSHIPVTMSIGVACCPEDGYDLNTLIALADANLYVSKSLGGATVTGSHLESQSSEDVSVFGMLGSLVTAVDNKDRYTRHHSEEVTELAISIGEMLGLSDESQRVLRVAGLLHDVGKVGVPDRILRKPGRITDDEYEAIKQHTLLGDAIIAAIPDLSEIRAGVVAHHERFDGCGYPNGLSGDQIPLMGRILAVADAYSAMVTDRPYRKALSGEEAIAELIAGKGTQFDPMCVDAFIKALEKTDKALAAEKAGVADEC